jgi:aminoglycoside phosphotransferase (APT) family kinase protein
MAAVGRPVACGRTAEIYPWRDHKVLKLFYEWFPEGDVRHEARIAQAVHAAGLAVPKVGEIIEVDGRLGLEYERLEGASMGDEMTARLWTLVRSARLLAELHAEVHATEGIEGMPSQRERLERKIRGAKGLGAELRKAGLRALERMPEGDQLCHGDFHPWNVIMTDGGAIVIDWFSATCGNPLADVARTAVVLESVREMEESVTWREKLMVQWCRRVYVRRYFELRPGGEEEYRSWRPIVAAGRMSEGIDDLEDWLRIQVEANEWESP